jgi:hypothetical protein
LFTYKLSFREKRKTETKEAKPEQPLPVAASTSPEPDPPKPVEAPKPEAVKKEEAPPVSPTSELMIDLSSSPMEEKLLLSQTSPLASKYSTSKFSLSILSRIRSTDFLDLYVTTWAKWMGFFELLAFISVIVGRFDILDQCFSTRVPRNL